MSLAVLEHNKQKHTETRVIKAGTKLLCYKNSYGYTYNKYYRISEIKDGYITVIDDDKIAVMFTSLHDLKEVFRIIFQ